MSSEHLGLKNDWAIGGIISADALNDLHETVDNQLGALREASIRGGVLSGWTITAETDFNVEAGEGWVGGAHCETLADQLIIDAGITHDATNYIYAQRKSAETGRVSESFSLGEVDFVANTTGVAPSNSILIASGVVNAAGTHFDSVNNAPAARFALKTIPQTFPGVPTFTIGAEAGNVINVGVQLNDLNGDPIDYKCLSRVWLSDAVAGEVSADPPSGTVVIGTDGVIIASLTAKVHLLVLSDATGAFDLNITEATADTWYLNLEYQGRVYSSSAITFAA